MPVNFKYYSLSYVPHLGKMPKVVPEYKEKAKKRILEAAAEVFAKKGYRAATMNDVAKRVNVSKGAIYQYFDCKEDLLRSMAAPFMERMLQDAYAPADRGMLETSFDAFRRYVDSTPDWVFVLMTDLYPVAGYDSDVKSLVKAMNQMHLERFRAFWEDRKKAGELPADLDVMAIGRIYVAMVIGLGAQIGAGLPKAEAIETWKAFVERMLAGIESKKKGR